MLNLKLSRVHYLTNLRHLSFCKLLPFLKIFFPIPAPLVMLFDKLQFLSCLWCTNQSSLHGYLSPLCYSLQSSFMEMNLLSYPLGHVEGKERTNIWGVIKGILCTFCSLKLYILGLLRSFWGKADGCLFILTLQPLISFVADGFGSAVFGAGDVISCICNLCWG